MLKLVTDRVEHGTETVHIHGEVNPTLDGNRIVVDFQGDSQLSTDEKNKLIKLPGGKEKLNEIADIEKGGSSKAKHEYAEVRTALDALESGQLNVK